MIQTVDVFLEHCGNKQIVGKLASDNRIEKFILNTIKNLIIGMKVMLLSSDTVYV